MSIFHISEFMQKGGQTVPRDVDRDMSTAELLKFYDRIEEEVFETIDAIGYFNEDWGVYIPEDDLPPRDIPEVVDGFLDIAYTALSAAIRLAGETKAYRAWWAVIDANLSKVNGRYGPPVIDPETGKIGKPEGWQAPNIEAILDRDL